MLRDCLPHGIWIETRKTGVSAADDSVNVTSIATSTACQLKSRIRREDCPGLPQTHPPPSLDMRPYMQPSILTLWTACPLAIHSALKAESSGKYHPWHLVGHSK